MGAVYAWENAAEASGAQIDVSSEALGLGVRSLLTPQIQDVWRSGAWSGTINLNIDLGVSRSDLRIFAIAAPKDAVLPSADAQVRLVASNTALGSADALNAGLIPMAMAPNGLMVWLLPAAITARYLQWRLVAGPSDTYLQLGRVWAGPALVTEKSVSYGQGVGYVDAGSSDRAGISAVRYSRPGAIRRQPTFTQTLLTQSERDALVRCINAVGTSRQVLVSPYETDISKEAVLGAFLNLPKPVRSMPTRWSVDISIDEDC